jgi:hypothetical protein
VAYAADTRHPDDPKLGQLDLSRTASGVTLPFDLVWRGALIACNYEIRRRMAEMLGLDPDEYASE